MFLNADSIDIDMSLSTVRRYLKSSEVLRGNAFFSAGEMYNARFMPLECIRRVGALKDAVE